MAQGPQIAREIVIPPVGLEGRIVVPEKAVGVVAFAHGSGSSRFSPRNNYVADALQTAGLATLLFDLLTDGEAGDRANVFDIALLAERLTLAGDWLSEDALTKSLPLGYFGASTGAAAALVAAARAPGRVAAVVSRGGRPDLAGDCLVDVTAPALLIVGGYDEQVLELNRAALDRLTSEKELAVVPGATHLFEEPGALDRVIDLARGWFLEHLPRQAGGAA